MNRMGLIMRSAISRIGRRLVLIADLAAASLSIADIAVASLLRPSRLVGRDSTLA
jgi:hypothetical protein